MSKDKLFVIEAKNPSFSGLRDYHFNAGSLTLVFHEGISAPIDEERADAFLKHFNRDDKKGYEKRPYTEGDAPPPPSPPDDKSKRWVKTYPAPLPDGEGKVCIRCIKKKNLLKEIGKVYYWKAKAAEKLVAEGYAEYVKEEQAAQ